jgi:CelD/BcsL family acetyltransferase involved in cellulose biosynthesis
VKGCHWITLQELEHRRAEWRRLAATCEFPTAFADPAWVLAWWQSYGDSHEPWCLAVEDGDGSLRALALLACRGTPLARSLTFAGGAWNGLNTLLCAPGFESEFCTLLLKALSARNREWDVWRIQRLPASSVLASTLLDGHGVLRAAAHDTRLQPFLALPGDTKTFEASFGSKQRNTQRRKWRRLEELGARARLVTDADEVELVLRTLLDLRTQRAKALNQRHEHMDARFERFILTVVRGMAPEGVRLWTLEADGETLAIRLNLRQGSREHSYLLGLGDAHAALSPGSSLERHAILGAITEGRTELDLGPGRDVYKYRLGADDRELMRLVVSSGSARGSCVAGLAAADLRLRNTAAADAVRRLRGLTPQHVRSEQAKKTAQQPQQPTSS